MKIEKLPRDFVYTDRRTLDDFLRSDDLNKELYKVYLQVKDRPYYFKFDAEKAFNEAYYIATLAMYDPHPELNVREWLWIAKGNMGWRYAANLVMSMVYAILYLQEDRPEKIDYVLQLMEGQDYGEDYFGAFDAMAHSNTARYKSDLTPHPHPVAELTQTLWDWKEITEDYEQDTIRELLALFPSKEEKLKLIDIIEEKRFETQATLIGSNHVLLEYDPDSLPF